MATISEHLPNRVDLETQICAPTREADSSRRVVQEKIEFWSNVYGFSMEPIKQMARSEPLVDTVQQDLVNSSVAKLASIDIRTMAEAEAAFSGEFELKFRRNDNMHAIVLWFDVVFGSSHKEARSHCWTGETILCCTAAHGCVCTHTATRS